MGVGDRGGGSMSIEREVTVRVGGVDLIQRGVGGGF